MKPQPNIPEATSSDDNEQRRKRDAIARGRADVAAGRVVDHGDVQRWVKSWGDDAPMARPKP